VRCEIDLRKSFTNSSPERRYSLGSYGRSYSRCLRFVSPLRSSIRRCSAILRCRHVSESILAVLLFLSMVCLVSCGGSIASTRRLYYVAPDGSDKNAGTISAPFATLAHARDIARSYIASGTKIKLRAGIYFLGETLQLDMRDSGEDWSAFPGEQVTLSGGKEITGWTGPDAQGRWLAPADLDNFRQLYVNGARAVRSRLPLTNPLMTVNTDTITGDAGFVIADEITKWKNPTDMEFGLFNAINQWSQSVCDVQSITTTASGTYVMLDNPCFYLARHKEGEQVTTSTYLENAFEMLSPGQFYFDRLNHIVYYIPRPGEDMKTAQIIAPLLRTVMSVTGTIDEPVNNLSFSGIAFAHTSWLEASSAQGFPEIQATLRINPRALITLSDGSLSSPDQEMIKTPGGVVLTYVSNATFERCSFAHMGGSGIDIQIGSTGNLISGAKVFDISANGIQIGDVLANDFAPPDPRMIVEGNTVSNSYVHDEGAEFTGAVGIFAGYTAQTSLLHNEVTHLPYTGISMGWGWGQEDPTPARENLVQLNYIHDTMQQREDGGGVYTLGSQPGSSIDSNLIVNNPGRTEGIYLDSGSDGISITNNVVYGKAEPDYPTEMPINFHGACLVLGCPISGNILDDPLATVPNVGLEAPYRDLLAN